MAGRIRTIKPELLEDERTASLSHEEFRLFVGLLLLADDHGNFRATPKMLDGAIFHTQESREGLANLLDGLARVSLVSLYLVRGQAYGHLRGWDKHQRVDHPSKPRVPQPTDEEAVQIQSLTEKAETLRESLATSSRDARESLAPDLRSPIPTTITDPEPSVTSDALPREEQDPIQHTREGADLPLPDLPPLPDAEWLAAELAKRPALARFAEDSDLCMDLAGGLQDRSRTHEQSSQIITAFAAKVGKAARDMTPAEFQKAFGGYVVNARLPAGGPSSEPQHPDVREALTIFAERWKHARGVARVEDADDAEHAAACIEMAKKAIVDAKSEARPREVYRRAVDAYLADSASWLADAKWPLRMLAKKFSSYASLPPPKARPGPAKAPEEPVAPTRRRATYAEAAAMSAGTKSGNMGLSLALVFDRGKASSG